MPMSLLGFALSLATGLAIACFYMFNKKAARGGSSLQVIFWIFAAHLPPLILWAAAIQPIVVDWRYLAPGMGVLALTIAGNLFAIRALSLSPFSLMLPVMCLSPVFTSLVGIPLLHEWPSARQWAGIILAVLGVLWLYAPPEKPWDIFSFWPNFFRERGAPNMALSALCWSLSAPMDKLALHHADPAFHALFVFTGLTAFLALWLTHKEEWRKAPIARAFWPVLALTGLAGAVADILQLLALQNIAAGPFEAIKRVSSQMLALVFGYMLFKENMTVPKIIGIVIISVGLPLIMF